MTYLQEKEKEGESVNSEETENRKNLTDLVAKETQTKNEANANMTTSDTTQKMFQKVRRQVRTEVQDISKETAGKSCEIKT